ncbi:MAG: sulfatase [Ginsengibacter sp.]
MNYLKNPLFIFLLFLTISKANAQKQQPNIIFFLVDDMGWQDTSVPFWDTITPANKKFHTPNMERLAKEGMKFTNAYAASVCTPSRISLMTGMNVARHKVSNWTYGKNQGTDHLDDDKLIPPKWNVNGLSPDPGLENSVYATTLPSLLSDAGYYTIQCGKAHFGAIGTPGADPLNLGFLKNIGGSAAGNPSSFLGEKNYGNSPGNMNPKAVPGLDKYWGTHTFLTEAITREAILSLDTARMMQKPFFLYMSHFAVHLPFDADDRFMSKYKDQGLTEPEAAYATLVEGMDKSLGDLMDYLQEKDLVENTIVIFMSDNGGYTREPRMGEMDTQNYPLRAGKGSLYEGGVREPMIVKWPGIVKPGSVEKRYVIIEDFFPTILEMAGINSFETVQQRDGVSMLPYLKGKGKKKNDRALIWNYPNKWYPGPSGITSYVSAMRQGKWKLIYFQKDGRLELYDLENDLSERNDLSKTNPKKLKQMAHLLTSKLKERGAQLAISKVTGEQVAYPIDLVK